MLLPSGGINKVFVRTTVYRDLLLLQMIQGSSASNKSQSGAYKLYQSNCSAESERMTFKLIGYLLKISRLYADSNISKTGASQL